MSSVSVSSVGERRVVDEFDVHDLASHHVEDGHPSGCNQRHAAMAWAVRAVRWRRCVEALTKAVAAAAWRMNPQVLGADGEVGLTLLIEECDEFGDQSRVDVA